jgi:hypothetical protein
MRGFLASLKVEERRTYSKEGNSRVLVQSIEIIGFKILIPPVSEAPSFATRACQECVTELGSKVLLREEDKDSVITCAK